MNVEKKLQNEHMHFDKNETYYFLTLDEISINLEILNFVNIITVCVHEVCA